MPDLPINSDSECDIVQAKKKTMRLIGYYYQRMKEKMVRFYETKKRQHNFDEEKVGLMTLNG